MLSEVCEDIEIEPKLTSLMGEELDSWFANQTNEARFDIRARGVWERGQQAFSYLRVFNPNPRRYFHKSLQQLHVMTEQEKKRAYNEKILQIEHGMFTAVCRKVAEFERNVVVFKFISWIFMNFFLVLVN